MAKAQTVIVYAPQGAGKGLHTSRLVKALGLDRVIDDWCLGYPMPPRLGALVLTNESPASMIHRGYRVMSLDEAMAAAQQAEVKPS